MIKEMSPSERAARSDVMAKARAVRKNKEKLDMAHRVQTITDPCHRCGTRPQQHRELGCSNYQGSLYA